MLPKDYGINHLKPFTTLSILFRFLLAQRQPALSTAFFFTVFSFTKPFFMVYLIHFEEKLHHAQHYIGFVDKNLNKRIKKHKSNKGAKLLMAVNNKGIPWEVVRVWEEGDRQLERRLKNCKKSRCFCPVCRNHH